jgi:hypothetical protein
MVSIDSVAVNGGKKAKAAGPLEQMTMDADRVEYEKDTRGRRIGCKMLTFLDTHRITCLLGENASNQTALMQALTVSSVVEIDGDPVSKPGSIPQLHALMARLDFAGVTAASVAMGRFVVGGQDGADAVDAIKN